MITVLKKRFDVAQIQSDVSAQLPDVQLLVLFGSRAKDSAIDRSNWDIVVQSVPSTYRGFQQLVLQDEIAHILGLSSDEMDLVNLRYCSPLLAFAVAKEGQLIYENESAAFHRFQVRAAKMYADTAKLRKLQNTYLGLEPDFGRMAK